MKTGRSGHHDTEWPIPVTTRPGTAPESGSLRVSRLQKAGLDHARPARAGAKKLQEGLPANDRHPMFPGLGQFRSGLSPATR